MNSCTLDYFINTDINNYLSRGNIRGDFSKKLRCAEYADSIDFSLLTFSRAFEISSVIINKKQVLSSAK